MPHPRNPHPHHDQRRRNPSHNNQNQNFHAQQQQQHYQEPEKEPLVQDPQDVMSTAIRLQWNIRVLQRHDPQITSIVDQFTYAVLYQYNGSQWVKRGVEGSMFVYIRKDPPIHGFCILNREGVGNFVQPLRKGDDMEVSDEYIVFRPANVNPEDFHNYLGIWTADLDERKHLNTFMSKFHQHLVETDEPYSPVLLYQPLARPEDAKLPLITPLPPPPGSQPHPQPPQTPQAQKKGKRQGNKQQPSPSPALAQAQAQTIAPPAAAEPGVTVDSLFSKFMATTHPATTVPPPPPPAELRGPALLQSMFASAAATGATATTTTTTTHTLTTTGATGQSETSAKEVTTSTTLSLPEGSTSSGNGTDGVSQGNALKQLLGIQASASADSSAPPRVPSNSSSRAGSIPPPTFKPINEDEEGTPPRIHTPPRQPNQKHQPPRSITPTPTSKRPGNNANAVGHRDLVPYDFEGDGDGPQGIVSPWAPAQRTAFGVQDRAASPSPSTLPQPKAIREKKGGRNNRRDGSPVPQNQQQQQQRRGSVSRNGPGPGPKKTYVPANNAATEHARKLDKDVAIDVLAGAISGTEEGEIVMSGGLSKETFVQELLALIHRKTDFVDKLYARYSEAAAGPGCETNGSFGANGHSNTVDLRD